MSHKNSSYFKVSNEPQMRLLAEEWLLFLNSQKFDFSGLKEIDMSFEVPIIKDHDGNKFSIDFVNDKKNYHKKKSGLKTEILARALGSGKLGHRVLDLSAGLGIDAMFLAQLGFHVTSLERNPLIFLSLKFATQVAQTKMNLNGLNFVSQDAFSFLESGKAAEFDVVYFDPMFPEKKKSALPRQEMVFFRNLVGTDEDSAQVLEAYLNIKTCIKRIVVKRPIKAPYLLKKPKQSISGKLVRFDIY